MKMSVYRATGVFMSAATRLLGLKLRITGVENLTNAPTLFVVNHFTRIETFLIPYAIFKACRRPVRTLAMDSLFNPLFKRYWHATGVMSVRDPRRNRTIVRDLVTGRCGWVIYPEGGLVKNKKTVRRGRLHLERPQRAGPPHTGAALLALKSETIRRRFRDAHEQNDTRRLRQHEVLYGLRSEADVSEAGTVMVPVTITYHSVRPRPNLISRIARLLDRNLDPRLDEELHVEGSILLGDGEVNIHFGQPIPTAPYLDAPGRLSDRIGAVLTHRSNRDLALRQPSRRLTDAAMESLYHGVEISVEHLFCYGLRCLDRDMVDRGSFHAALFLAATELQREQGVRLHPTLTNGVAPLLDEGDDSPLRGVIERCVTEGVLAIENGHYRIDRSLLNGSPGFHRIRLERMSQVLANEIEPVTAVTETVRRAVNLSRRKLAASVSRALLETDLRAYEEEHAIWTGEANANPAAPARPTLLRARGAAVGVVLVHGYLSSPEQMRPLARYLHDRGCTVYTVRLPGHGTSPENLADVSWRQWMAAIEQAHGIVRQYCSDVVIGGLSLGAALSLLAAAEHPGAFRGVFSVNASLKLRDRRARLVPTVVRGHELLRRVGLVSGHPQAARATEHPEMNYGKVTLHNVRELQRAVRKCWKRLPDVTVPALIVQSTQDPVVRPDTGRDIVVRIGAARKTLFEPAIPGHAIVLSPDREIVFEQIGTFIDQLRQSPVTGRGPWKRSIALTTPHDGR